MTGLYTLSSVCAALYHRERTGQGQHISASLLETQIATLVNAGQAALVTGEAPRRWGTAHPSIVPYQVFEVADGDVLVAAMNDAQFAKLATAMGVGHLSDDDRFRTNPNRVQHRDVLLKQLSRVFKGATREHWLRTLEEAGVTVAPGEPRVVERCGVVC